MAYIMLLFDESYCDMTVTSIIETARHPLSTFGLWPRKLNDRCVHLICIYVGRIGIYRAKKHAYD